MRFSKEIRLAFFYIKRYRALVVLSIFVLLAGSLFEGLGLGMIIPILESIEGVGRESVFKAYAESVCSFLNIEINFQNLVIIFGVIMLIGYGIQALQKYLSRVLSASLTYELRDKAFGNLMDLPLSYYYNKKIGDIIATLYTSSQNSGAIAELAMQMFTAFVLSLIYIFINLLISIPLTTVACGLAVVSYVLIMPRFKMGFTYGKEEKNITDSISSFLQDKLGGIRVVKSFNKERVHLQDFRQVAQAFKRIQIKIQNNRILAGLLLEPFIFILIIFLLIFSVSTLHMPIASLIAFFFIFTRILPKIRLFNSNYMQTMELLPHFIKIEEIIRQDDKYYLTDGSRKINTIHSGITFENVWFRYSGSDEYVLKNVSINIERNATLGLVGISGGGKTTVVNLLMRLHDPEKGHVKIDGVDLSEIKKQDIHNLLSVVEQDVYLFNDTIYNNILYGKLNAKQKEVFWAAKLANAHSFIQEFPNKYDTVVGARGMKLSGGEKQRISLARALLKNPEVLILDEATSALDSESEKLIQESIAKLSRSKTIIIIAHRLSTVANADKIIVIENGEIVEEGNHKELLKKNKVYKKYFSLQH